jgi:O-antigen/teichoic acid export membrane protein
VIIARLISPADYGIAAVFATILSLLEMLSNLAASSLLIQASDGDEVAFQNTAQMLAAVRGIWNAALFLLLAGPVSHLFGVPQAEWAFRYLAVIPLARGFAHLDTSRFQRGLRFGPTVLVDVGSNLATTLLALPAALWLRDYSAMLWILVLQSVGAAVGSHLVAERRYCWGWDKRYAKRIFAFGWPLLINGILMYGIMEGDRVVIGSARRLFPHSAYTLTDLGVYSVAFALTMAPTSFVATVAGSLFLPVLSRVKEFEEEFKRRYLGCLHAVLLAAATISLPFIFAGGGFVGLIYGPKYAAAGSFIGWLAAMFGIRLLRVAPTLAAMARADTKALMLSNLGRSLALVGMVLAAATGSRLIWISISGFGGELFALGILLWRLKRLHGVPVALHARPFALIGLGMLVAGVLARLGAASVSVFIALLGSAILVLATVSVMILVIPGLRSELWALLFSSHSVHAVEPALAGVRPNPGR